MSALSAAHPHRRKAAARAAAIALALLVFSPAGAGVLGKDDLERVSSIKANFMTMIVDVGQSLRRTDLSDMDRECINTISQDLLHIAQELSGYESLMKIETQLDNVGDDSTTREVVMFAMVKALDVLNAERKRLAQPPDPCGRLPVSNGKAQSVLQVIEATIATLEGVRSRVQS